MQPRCCLALLHILQHLQYTDLVQKYVCMYVKTIAEDDKTTQTAAPAVTGNGTRATRKTMYVTTAAFSIDVNEECFALSYSYRIALLVGIAEFTFPHPLDWSLGDGNPLHVTNLPLSGLLLCSLLHPLFPFRSLMPGRRVILIYSKPQPSCTP